MTDDGRGRGSVNLEELERQLREASRNRARSLASEFGSANESSAESDVPDVVALTRQFVSRSNPQIPATPEADPWRPSFNTQVQSPTGTVGYPGQGIAPSSRPAGGDADADPFYPPPPAFMRAQNPNLGPSTSESPGFQGDLSSGFGAPGRERFPEIERPVRSNGRIFRAAILLAILFIGVGLVYFYETGRFSVTMGVQSDQRQVPVIKPDPNPVKIVPDSKTAETPPAGTELFSKNAADGVAKVTTRSTAEEPVDINAVAKNASTNKSLVPGMGDPKAVKTVTVRPDGTIVGDAQIAPLTPNADAAPAVAQPPKNVPAPPQTPPVTPSSKTETPVTTPATVAQTQSNSSTTNSASTNTPLPPLSGPTVDVPLPTPRPADIGKAAPVVAEVDPLAELAKSVTDDPVAETTNENAPPLVTGDYAVQFGAPAAENDANGLAKRVRTEFATQIDGREVAVIKADSNGKTVYRVRAVGFTRDEASAACADVTAAGGKCFIARN